MKHALAYSLKVWSTTSIVSPILISLLRLSRLHHFLSKEHSDIHFADEQYHKLLLLSLNSVWFSLVILIPLCVALYYVSIWLNKRNVPKQRHKPYLSIAGVLAILFPFALITCYYILELPANYLRVVDLYEIMAMCVVYAVVGFVSIWIYKLKPVNTLTENPR